MCINFVSSILILLQLHSNIVAGFNIIPSTQKIISSLSPTALYSDRNNMSNNQAHQQNDLMSLNWSSMSSFRKTSLPSDFCPDSPTISNPRLATDEMYAKAVLEAWKKDIHDFDGVCDDDANNKADETASDNGDAHSKDTIGAPIRYLRQSDDTYLNGYIVMNSNLLNDDDDHDDNKVKKTMATSATMSERTSISTSVPAVILFHTGAGPQDIFLRWKADMIARDEMWGENGCIVFIADIVSDSTGWTWTDRDRYDTARKDVLGRSMSASASASSNISMSNTSQRWKLRETITAALDALKNIHQVDGNRIGAMGWCLGGHPVLELGRMKVPGVRALVTFHGVFDGIVEDIPTPVDNTKTATTTTSNNSKLVNNNDHDHDNHQHHQHCVLICNGKSDPFISQDNLDTGKKTFESHQWDTQILNFENVKHGFTNPAQDYNPSNAFAFNDNAANISWDATMKLLRKQLL